MFQCRWILPQPEQVLEGGGLLVRDGRVERVARGPAEVRRLSDDCGANMVDLGEGVLAPGLVNAHAHLELTALEGRVSAAEGFGAWIRTLLEARGATSEQELAGGVLRGAQDLLRSGTTSVGDISTLGLSGPLLARHPIRARVYVECLDGGDERRTAKALEAAQEAVLAHEGSDGMYNGLAPHAPFTVSRGLWQGLGDLARATELPVTIHWSETQAELDYLLRGEGPLADMLGPSPLRSGLELIEAAGLLGPSTSLVHGNLPAPDEPRRLAEAGATLVHCAGTHAFFDRQPAPLGTVLDAGVSLALGTDSLASNHALDMRAEMATLRRAEPQLAPEAVWSAATLGGARALGFAGRAGTLAQGAWADMAHFDVNSSSPEQVLEDLTCGIPPVLGVWTCGQARSIGA